MSVRALVESQIVVSLNPDVTVEEAARVMERERIGSVIVLRDDTLAGIFTERDLLNKVVAKGLDCHRTVLGDVMTDGVVTVSADVSVDECYHKMETRGFRHLPVVEDGKVLGMISIRNLVDLVIQQLSYERDLLKQYVQGQ